MALRWAIYGFFLHTDYSNNIFAHGSHRTHGFYSFHSWCKKYLVGHRWEGGGNLIHGIDGIGMRCDTWQMWHRFLRTFSLYYFLFKINYLFFLRARGYFIKTCVICVICHTLRRCLSAWNSSSWRLPSTMNDVFVNIGEYDVRVLPD